MDIYRDQVEFSYKDQIYPARIDRYYHDGNEKDYVINFTYKGVNVSHSYDGKLTNYYSIAQNICKMIDEIGQEKYEIYSNYIDEIESMEIDHVLIGENVYNYFKDDSHRSGDLIYYIMGITMQDGTHLDGSSPSKYFYEEEKKSKNKSFENLKQKVKDYYHNENILPEEKWINKELTKKYQEMVTWIRENAPSTLK